MGTFVGSAANGANIATLTGVTWPTHQSGDLAILAWTFADTITNTTPAGFTLVGTLDDPSCRSYVYKRVCDGTESGDVSLVNSGINRQTAVLVVLRGYSGVDASASRAETVTGTSHACPALTFTNGSTLVVVAAERLTTGTTTATAPSGYTKRAEFGTGGTGGTYTQIADDGLATSQTSPVTPPDFTGFVSGGTAVTWTIALTPSLIGSVDPNPVWTPGFMAAMPQAFPWFFSRKVWSWSYDTGVIAAASAAGVAAAAQRSETDTAGVKQAGGAGVATARTTTSSTGIKQVTGAAIAAGRATTTGAARKQATGTTAAAVRAAITTAGIKGTAGAAIDQQRTTTT